jgi:hypothetical protein
MKSKPYGAAEPFLLTLSKRFLLFAGMIFLFSPLHAAFQDIDWGARPVGMGGAFTAIADDANAPLYNPAGLVQVQWNEVSAMYAQLFTGVDLNAGQDTIHLDQSYLAYVAKPISHIGSLGLSWSSFAATHLYREDTLTLTYARNAGDFIPVLGNSLAAGVNLKYLRRGITLDSLTTNDPVFSNGDTASAVTFDAGLLYKPEDGALEGWRLGLAGQNLTDPNVGFGGGAPDDVPRTWRAGLAYQSKDIAWLVPSMDVTRRDGITQVQGGFESWLFQDTLGLRAGGNQQEASTGVSYYYAANKKYGLRLDYALTLPFYVEGTSGSHRLALTLYF